ncbi:MAG: aryl-sulfate sulfotransferase [Myxococcales bacterium]|nr:aryl-sulfate sulfotransferase [Myxococcales bacterium]
MGRRGRHGRGRVLGALVGVAWLAAGCRFAEGRLEAAVPASGAPGTVVVLEGSGFGDAPGWRQACYDGRPLDILSWSDDRIEAVLPSEKNAGPYAVEIRTPAGAWPTRLTHELTADTARSAPVVDGITVRARANNPLAATVTFRTDEPATPIVAVEGPTGVRSVPPSGIRSDVPGTDHEVVILGLRPATTYAITVGARNGAGRLGALVHAEHRTVALRASVLPIEILKSRPDRMAPGYTLLSVYSFAYLGDGFLFALDSSGAPVWMYRAGIMQAAERLADGTIAITTHKFGSDVIELISPFGEIVADLRAHDLGLDTFHHDVVEMPDGHLLTLSTELRTIDGYPGGARHDVVGDVVVELTREGDVVGSWPLLDMLDPHRVGQGFDDPYWLATYGTGAKDWSHANAVGYDPEDDGIWVSLRHQDAIVKFRRSDGALLWVVGTNDPKTSGDDAWPFLRFTGEGRLPSEQHDPHVVSGGRLWVYDNGNASGVTRAVLYDLDPVEGTLSQHWAWVDPDYAPPLFGAYVGGVDPLSNGNVLIAHGGLGGTPADLENPTWIHLSEVDPARDEKLFEARIRGELGYIGYRARRIDSLYP